MKSSLQLISSAGSAVALLFGLHRLAERLDPVSSQSAKAGAKTLPADQLIECAAICNVCSAEVHA